MNRLSRSGGALTVLAFVLFGPAAATAERLFPHHGNAGYDVLHYDLSLDAQKRDDLVGAATLDIRAERRLAAFDLDLQHMTATSVRVDGAAASFQQTTYKLHITPARSIAENERFVVEIAYRGDPTPLLDPTSPGDPHPVSLGWIKAPKGASYVVSEPIGATTFFPCNDEPSDKATFTFRVTVTKPFAAVANGALDDVQNLGGARRFVWSMRAPMTTWNATVQISDAYRLRRKRAGRVPLRFYTTPRTSTADLRAFGETPAIMAFLEGIAGPYPFDSYGSVVVDDPALEYPLETQSISTFPPSQITVPLVAHELAHQWFGNSVTPREWQDIWLAEGFAQYLEALYPRRDRPAAFHAYMRSLHADVQRRRVGPVVVSTRGELFEDRTYNRGAVALYALRLRLGEKRFHTLLRAWCEIFRHKTATTGDFVALAQKVGGEPGVRPFLESWLFDPVVPDLPADADSPARSDPAL